MSYFLSICLFILGDLSVPLAQVLYRAVKSFSFCLRSSSYLQQCSSITWNFGITQSEPNILCLVCMNIGPCRGSDEDPSEVVSPGQVQIHSPAEHAQRHLSQSEISIQVTWSVLTNQRSVFRSRDLYWPIRDQYSGHVTCTDQSGVSIQDTWQLTMNDWKLFS